MRMEILELVLSFKLIAYAAFFTNIVIRLSTFNLGSWMMDYRSFNLYTFTFKSQPGTRTQKPGTNFRMLDRWKLNYQLV